MRVGCTIIDVASSVWAWSPPRDRLLPALLQRGHKTLIFSQMTQMLDIIGDYLSLRGIAYCRIDGGVPYVERQEQVGVPPQVVILRGPSHALTRMLAMCTRLGFGWGRVVVWCGVGAIIVDYALQQPRQPRDGVHSEHACRRPWHQSDRSGHVHHLRQRLGTRARSTSVGLNRTQQETGP